MAPRFERIKGVEPCNNGSQNQGALDATETQEVIESGQDKVKNHKLGGEAKGQVDEADVGGGHGLNSI